MIRSASLRWRLVAWVGGALALALAVTFAVVYVETGNRLRDEINSDVHGDLAQLVETARALPAGSPSQLARRLHSYVNARPLTSASSVLFAIVAGHVTVSNHPELFGAGRTDDGETAAEQARENAEGHALLAVADGPHTLPAADVGPIRLDVRTVAVHGMPVKLGVGEPLIEVVRAQRGMAAAFLAAGAAALVIVLLASYLAGAAVLAPLRRLSRVAGRIEEGDLAPRMEIAPTAGREIRVLAESFNHMLDRLADAFEQQRAFVADASHELRTPLTVIGGQLEVLAALPEPTAEDIEHAQRLAGAEVTRMARLVDDLLVLARSEQRDFVRPSVIDLAQFTRDLWTATTTGHARHFELGRVPRAELRADPDRLAQAVRNLIANAIAHTRAPDGLVRLEVQAGAREVRFAVIDDGPGIPAAERERVFDRFHRTDVARTRAAGGTGLGLAIVRAIAVAHGGLARVAAPGSARGARVEIVIPAR